jgi:hypothetical protein
MGVQSIHRKFTLKSPVNWLFSRQQVRCDFNINLYFGETNFENVRWIKLAQDRVREQLSSVQATLCCSRWYSVPWLER